MESTPNQLLQRANMGDKDAYLQLLQWLTQYCKNIITLTLRPYKNFPPDSLDDIVQEFLITFHEVHQTFDHKRPLLPWINSIIRHKTIDYIRRKDFRVMMTSTELDLILEELKYEVPVEDSDLFEEMVETLGKHDAEIIRLAKVEGHSSKEIASLLHLTDANVKVIIHRGLKKLRALSSFLKK